MTDNTTYVSYDYATPAVPRELESLHADTYRNFGWELESRARDPRHPGSTVLKLKRDRGVAHKSTLTELQRRCDAALETIARLERSKSSVATQVALTWGLIGSAFLAVAVFAITDWDLPLLTAGAGALGLAGWAIGYFSHDRARARRSDKVAMKIDEQYEIVHDTSEQAAKLLG